MINSLAGRFRGCLVGLAVGDTLGCPVEGLHPDTIRERFGTIDRLIPLSMADVSGPYFWRLPGLHSDDTQQALCLVDVLVEHGRFDDSAAGSLLGMWRDMAAQEIVVPHRTTGKPKRARMAFGAHRGTGRCLRRRVRNPVGPPSTSIGDGAADDGAAMRVAPVGLFFHVDPEARVDAALRSSLVTHGHPHAVEGAAAVAAAVAHCLDESCTDAAELLDRVAEETARAADRLGAVVPPDADVGSRVGELAAAVKRLSEWVRLPLERALGCIVSQAREALPGEKLFATHSMAMTAVVTSLLVAARNLEDYRSAIVEAVNLGGDTDTIGAMVGAIVGARLGVEAIPPEWNEGLVARDQVLLRADALLTGEQGEGWAALIELESHWTTVEAVTRDLLLDD